MKEGMNPIIRRILELDYQSFALIYVNTKEILLYGEIKQGKLEISEKRWNYEEGLQRMLRETVVPEEVEYAIEKMKLSSVVKELEREDAYVYICKIRKGNGGSQYQKWKYAYVDGRRDNILYTRSDISELHMVEEQQKECLKASLLQMEQDNRRKTKLLLRINRDVRNSLNAIIGMAMIGSKEEEKESMQECIIKMKHAANELAMLLRDYKDILLLENGQMTLKVQKFNFREFLFHLRQRCLEVTKAKGIFCRIFDASFYDEFYIGDREKLEQVLMHLIYYAAKSTSKGEEIRLTIYQEQRNQKEVIMHFMVKDIGFGDESAFNLVASQQLTELLGGRLFVKNIEGIGSEFMVEIPLRVVDSKSLIQMTDYNVGFHRQRILLVEDHQLNQEVIKALLEKKNAVVELAKNGLEAIESFITNPAGYYDAILMEIYIPFIDGIKVTQSIRSTKKADAKTVPIITMSEDALFEDVLALKKVGMNIHLEKPIDPMLLYRTLYHFFY